PGRIITAVKQSASSNPLLLLDEIDKLGSDFRGDPSAALLEVLDSEQNVSFRDHYIEIPFDLSKVLFVATANNLSTVPRPLLDRMEVIELSSYTREEKFHIGKKYLIPKQLKKHGLSTKQLSVTKAGLYCLIDSYTREAGVRSLERRIAALCRKTAKSIVAGECEAVTLTPENVTGYLGPHKYKPDDLDKQNHVGIANGLAWTSVGGEILQVEIAVLEGTGKTELTGSLGDVMKESARAAISYIRYAWEKYGIENDFYKTKDLHIHFPEGAVPKDGPSAGITMATALVSALSGISVRGNVAMTGEISLRGRVMAIGGLKEKAMAAFRAGIKTVIIPEANIPDLDEIDKAVRDAITFMPVKQIDEVLKIALEKPAKPKPKKPQKMSLEYEKIADKPVTLLT
ncbi:MAG: AAA family ATPase, partial [Oscillospiraceae bacterium]|nr:AAA family ATPase [Oscillospiraceae bacterium]